MNPKRITIIPFLHGKLTRDGKMSEPDIYWIMEKWLDRHPETQDSDAGHSGQSWNDDAAPRRQDRTYPGHDHRWRRHRRI